MAGLNERLHQDPPEDWIDGAGELSKFSFGDFIGQVFSPIGLIVDRIAEWFD